MISDTRRTFSTVQLTNLEFEDELNQIESYTYSFPWSNVKFNKTVSD